MNSNFKNSLERAINLLGTPNDYENYLSIKIQPIQGGCCCFHCWPNTWSTVNKYISPIGPLKDEGDVLIGDKNDKFVLECHESGPEIIVYIGLVAASIGLVKSIIEIINTLLNARSNEPKGQPLKLKLTKRHFIYNKSLEENIMDIELPLSRDSKKLLNDKILEVFGIK